MINYFSYIISLVIVSLLYTKMFATEFTSIFPAVLFVFSLPSIFMASTYVFYKKYPLEIYILQYMGIVFSLFAIGYYFIFIVRPTILSVSLFFFLESILVFSSYLRLKK